MIHSEEVNWNWRIGGGVSTDIFVPYIQQEAWKMHTYIGSDVIWKCSVYCEECQVGDEAMLDMEEKSSVLDWWAGEALQRGTQQVLEAERPWDVNSLL